MGSYETLSSDDSAACAVPAAISAQIAALINLENIMTSSSNEWNAQRIKA